MVLWWMQQKLYNYIYNWFNCQKDFVKHVQWIYYDNKGLYIRIIYFLLPASPKAKAGLGVGSLRPSVRPKILTSQLLWNYWSNYHEIWYVDRTSYVVMHIRRKFWSPHFCGSYASWNLENTHKWPCHRNSSETTDPIFMKLGM